MSTAKSTTVAVSTAPKLTEQELTATFRQRGNELQAIATKIGELEREAEEHSLVIQTLQEAFTEEPDRKAFKLIGGILVERTVKDVLPELESNMEQLRNVLETLVKDYKKKDVEFMNWQKEHNIVVKQR